MLSEFKPFAPSEMPRFLAPAVFHLERSGESDRRVAVLGNGRDSLAVSPDQARLRMSLFELGRKLVIGPANTVFFETPLSESLFPAVIDSVCFEGDYQENQRRTIKLIVAFEETPLEDGINHPAEWFLDEALRLVDVQHVLVWLRTLVTDVRRPLFASSVLRCLGRRRPGTPAWRAGIVRAVLAADDVEMRDAAVQAAESWGGIEVREVLQSHFEVRPWLRAYLDEVIEDLGK